MLLIILLFFITSMQGMLDNEAQKLAAQMSAKTFKDLFPPTMPKVVSDQKWIFNPIQEDQSINLSDMTITTNGIITKYSNIIPRDGCTFSHIYRNSRAAYIILVSVDINDELISNALALRLLHYKKRYTYTKGHGNIISWNSW